MFESLIGMFFVNKNEAVFMLKEVLESECIHCPDVLSFEGPIDSPNVRLRIKTATERDKPMLKKIVLGFGLCVNEEKGTMVIF